LKVGKLYFSVVATLEEIMKLLWIGFEC